MQSHCRPVLAGVRYLSRGKYHSRFPASCVARTRSTTSMDPPGGCHQKNHNHVWEGMCLNLGESWGDRLGKRSRWHPELQHSQTTTEKPSWFHDQHRFHTVTYGVARQGEFPCEEGTVQKNRGSTTELETEVHVVKEMVCRPSKLLGSQLQVLLKLPFWLERIWKPELAHSGIRTLWVGATCFPERGDELQSLCKHGQLDKAVNSLMRMDQQGMVCSVSTYRALLKACVRKKALAQAKRVQGHLAKYGLETTRLLGEHVVSTLVRCGGLQDALLVFHRLPRHGVFSWTAVIFGHTTSGRGREALEMYQSMQEEGVQPDAYTFVSLFKACGMVADLEKGRRIHAEAVKCRCVFDLFVGNSLVDMYGKCGSIVDAQHVFDGLPQRDVVSWTTMLAAYAQQGQAEKALQLFDQMREEGVSPNSRTFVSALQACGMLAEKEQEAGEDGRLTRNDCLRKGKAIHAQAQKKGYDLDVFVGNTLVSMYGKCGGIVDAQNVFDSLTGRDVVAWTAMITGYVEHNRAEKALQLYKQMSQEGVSPDARTFVIALQACGMLAAEQDVVMDGRYTKLVLLDKGKAIHGDAKKKGYDSDVFVSSSLVSMYAKCGSVADSRKVFDSSSQRDVVSWTAMLTAYVELGQADKALELYEQMRVNGVSPDVWIIVSALQACCILAEMDVDGGSSKLKSLKHGNAIHADVLRKGYGSVLKVGNTLVSMYGKCGRVVDAREVFDGLSHRDVVSWTAMLATYAQQGQAQKALQMYDKMSEAGVSPDARMFVCALQACGLMAENEEGVVVDWRATKSKSLEKGRAIHDDAWRKGYSSDVFVGNTLVSMYGKCGSIVDAQNVFNDLSQRNVVTWNVLIGAYAQQGQGEQALKLYEQMQQEGASPDEFTLVTMLQVCSNTGSLALLRQIHDKLALAAKNLTPFVVTTLITAYGRCASMEDAQRVFDVSPKPDVVLWSALIAAYARQGNFAGSLQRFQDMQVAGIRPDGVTFVSLLCACSHAGLVDKGIEYFESMSRDYGLNPDIEHYVSMVDLFGRAGCFKRAEELLSKMPMQPNLDIWLCLLGACQKHGDVTLGKRAFDSAIRLHPQHSAAYVLMSNIYADAGLADRAQTVEKSRQKECAWKIAGQSWIEYGQKVHTFLVEDSSNLRLKKLHWLLQMVSIKLREAHLN